MSEETEIAEMSKKHIEAFNRADIDTMAETTCEDSVAMPPHQPSLKGKQAVVDWISEGFAAGKSKFDFTPGSIQVSGNLAIDHFDWAMETTMKDSGEITNDIGNCIWIWRKEPDGQWRIWRAIWNSTIEAQSVWSGASRE